MSPHGTISRYVNGKCRCSQCKEAHRLYMRDYRQRVRDGHVGRRHRCPTCTCNQGGKQA